MSFISMRVAIDHTATQLLSSPSVSTWSFSPCPHVLWETGSPRGTLRFLNSRLRWGDDVGQLLALRQQQEARWKWPRQPRQKHVPEPPGTLFGAWNSRKPQSSPSSPTVGLAEVMGSMMITQSELIYLTSASPLPGWDLKASPAASRTARTSGLLPVGEGQINPFCSFSEWFFAPCI